MKSFHCITLSPAGTGHPGIALATLRAGGIGLIDLEFCKDLPQAEKNLAVLIAEAERFSGGIGLRLHARQIAQAQNLLNALVNTEHYLLLCGAVPRAFTRGKGNPSSTKRSLLIEVFSPACVEDLQKSDIAGFVAKGNESGGRVSEDSAFILAQKILSLAEKPVYIQGGAGVHAVAACRAAGGAGLVLEEQLLLMPESSFPAEWRHYLENSDGTETIVLGETISSPCRVFSRPGFKVVKSLRDYSDRTDMTSHAGAALKSWHRTIDESVGWEGPDKTAWPIGQAAGLAKNYYDLYKTTGRLIKAVLRSASGGVLSRGVHNPLRPNSPLARSHGTEYPIVQGPMARVSDVPEFAGAVAGAGALPFLALSYMPGNKITELLKNTARLLGRRPWGVGLLGFIPEQLWQEQIQAVLGVKPPFALIAGGQPHQAAHLDSQGIATYIHVPSPAILRFFLEKGLRRFVFEGRECGGHIGPLSSFTLWENVIGILLERSRSGQTNDLDLLFAGGIHDARSAAMVGAMTSPLAERGMRIGVVMGSAYLFTQEASATGAITETFQKEALSCRHTLGLESGPGHSVRSAATPFAYDFIRKRRDLTASGLPADQVKETLEKLSMGRLRAASKGLMRDTSGKMIKIDARTQEKKGLFMIGQLATMRDKVVTSAQLHREICVGSSELLDSISSRGEDQGDHVHPKTIDIAIIGIGTLLPKAQDPETYWHNIVHKISAISEIPAERWDWRLYYDPDPGAKDKIYSKWGTFLDEIPFDPVRYGIPPKSVKSIDPIQFLALEVVRQSLEDAGYANGGFDKENTSVIFGAGPLGEYGVQYHLRAEIPRFVDAPSASCLERLPEWTEESFTGFLMNITAGRVANRFDFGGLNFTIDAACASSLAAVHVAVSELESGRSNMVIAGGADTSQGPLGYMSFSKTLALSPSGRISTFDQAGDGTVVGEGLAAVVLKRLQDAESDGDRIYAVIKAVSGSSDGKALGLTAPLPAGQMRAVERAYKKAGFPPSSVGLIEAHGTGTQAGDRAEAETVIQTLRAHQTPPKTCALGSVKPLIGHTKAASGIAGLIKVALALKHRVLPPHPAIHDPLEAISDPESPVHLLREARPWFAAPNSPRRGGVSAFGFGGTNFHAVLEEYAGDNGPAASPPGGMRWPSELFIFGAASREAMAGKLNLLLKALQRGARPRLRDLAYTCAFEAGLEHYSVRVSFVVNDLAELSQILEVAVNALGNDNQGPLPVHMRIKNSAEGERGLTAFVFPGQGSQSIDMCREISLYFTDLREAVEDIDSELRDCFPKNLSSYIFPPSAYTEAEREKSMLQLAETHIAQPALAAVESGLSALLGRLRVLPDMTAGHSFGEYVALYSAGALSRQDLFRLAEFRGRILKETGPGEKPGTMAAVLAEKGTVQDFLKDFPELVIANYNAPLQSVISGPQGDVREAAEKMGKAGVPVRFLAVSGAFHSPLMQAAQDRLTTVLAATKFSRPAIPVFSNSEGDPYPQGDKAIKKMLSRHLLSRVDFVTEIRNMYEAGARVFIEMGPGNVLSDLIKNILADRQCTVIPLDGSGGGLRGFLSALGAMFTEGIGTGMSQLFHGRDVNKLDLKNLAAETASFSETLFYVSGAAVRHHTEREGLSGRLPQLTRETAEQAHKARMGQPNNSESQAAGIHQAFAAYQDTMREFLRLQEQVMQQFLTGQAAPAEQVTDVRPQSIQNLFSPLPIPQVKTAQPRTSAELHGPENATRRESRLPSRKDNVLGENIDWTRQKITGLLLETVSARTGYPIEMLGLEQDLEAELGIDSIKRVEILSLFQGRLPSGFSHVIQTKMEIFSRLKALHSIVDELMESCANSLSRSGNAAAAGHPALQKTHAGLIPGSVRVPRFVMRAETGPIEGTFIRPSGLYLITQDALIVAPRVAKDLKKRGAAAEIVSRDLLYDIPRLKEAVSGLTRKYGPVSGIVHLAPLDESAIPSTLGQWRRYSQLFAKGFFHLVRLCVRDLSEACSSGNGRVLCASMSGGSFGRKSGGGRSVPAARAGVGIINSLIEEWPEISVKAVDFDNSASPSGLAGLITEELLCEDGSREIGYISGSRTIFRTAPALLDSVDAEKPLSLPGDAIILATGGARGVTAEIVNELAEKGMTAVLIGLSPGPGDEPAETAEIHDRAGLRNFLIGQTSREGTALSTPALIEKKVAALLRSREIRTNISRLRNKGVHVEYHAADVRNEKRFGTLIDEVYNRYGRIDAVVHGAGVIEDSLLINKTEESFDRVFDTKVDGGFILYRHLRPDSLRYIILFSSVAGRYGNFGQADYAAANETLNQLAWTLHTSWENTRVVSINWGPWEGLGMASAEVVRKLSRERGIIPIPVGPGLDFFRDELRYGGRDDVEVIAGDGPWHRERMQTGQR